MSPPARTRDSRRTLESGPLLYEPTNEQGVVALFSWLCEDEYGLRMEEVRTGYPDCIAKGSRGRVRIEFEFESSRFNHADLKQCDWLVCWIDNDKPDARWRKGPHRLACKELRPLFPELGRKAWIQPYKAHRVRRFSEAKLFDEWTVPSQARKGDILLVYRSGRDAAFTHIMELRSNAEYAGKHRWGRGFQADLRKLLELPHPVSRQEALRVPALKDVSFLKNPTPLGQSAEDSWEPLTDLMLKKNPKAGIRKALKGFPKPPPRRRK